MSIGTARIARGSLCHAFVKHDGSNLRFEWTKKSGFRKFGTRTQLFDQSDPIFGEAVAMIADDVGPRLLADLRSWDKRAISEAGAFVGFAEFFGRASFAGSHQGGDPKMLRVFDVAVGGELMDPKGFAKMSEGSGLYAPCLGPMAFNDELIARVYAGGATPAEMLLQEVEEGLVLKRMGRSGVEAVKLKTKAWLDAVKGRFDDWESRV